MLAIAMLGTAQAQNVTRNTLITRPGPSCGQDALIQRSSICNWANQNYGSDQCLIANAWTYNAISCGVGEIRSLIDFPDLDLVPTSAVVVSATLRLYGPTTATHPANSQLSGNNDGWIRQITSTWSENTVTWNTQPSTTLVNQVTVPGTTTTLGYNVTLNVTAMVQNMVNNAPSNRFGFCFLLQNETYYRSLAFCSSDHATLALRPELEVVYEYSCGAASLSTYTVSYIGDEVTESDLARVNDNRLLVYPNPSNESFFTLDFKNTVRSEAEINVINSLGQVVRHVSYTAEKDVNRYVLDLSGLPKGNYNVSIIFTETSLSPLHQQILLE
ncbi:hypothetical protein D3C71_929560 [compost metagenome]